MGLVEWVITRNSGEETSSLNIYSTGGAPDTGSTCYNKHTFAIRPEFRTC